MHIDSNKARHGQLIHSAEPISNLMPVLHQETNHTEIVTDHYNCSFVSPSPTRQSWISDSLQLALTMTIIQGFNRNSIS